MRVQNAASLGSRPEALATASTASPENAPDFRILRRASSAASRPFPALILP